MKKVEDDKGKQEASSENKVAEVAKPLPIKPWRRHEEIELTKVVLKRWEKDVQFGMELILRASSQDEPVAIIAAREHFKLLSVENLRDKTPEQCKELIASEPQVDDMALAALIHACDVVPCIVEGPSLKGKNTVEKAFDLMGYLSNSEIRDLASALYKRNFSSFT